MASVSCCRCAVAGGGPGSHRGRPALRGGVRRTGCGPGRGRGPLGGRAARWRRRCAAVSGCGKGGAVSAARCADFLVPSLPGTVRACLIGRMRSVRRRPPGAGAWARGRSRSLLSLTGRQLRAGLSGTGGRFPASSVCPSRARTAAAAPGAAAARRRAAPPRSRPLPALPGRCSPLCRCAPLCPVAPVAPVAGVCGGCSRRPWPGRCRGAVVCAAGPVPPSPSGARTARTHGRTDAGRQGGWEAGRLGGRQCRAAR